MLGTYRLGSVRLGLAKLCPLLLGSPRLASVRPGTDRPGSALLGAARHGLALSILCCLPPVADDFCCVLDALICVCMVGHVGVQVLGCYPLVFGLPATVPGSWLMARRTIALRNVF